MEEGDAPAPAQAAVSETTSAQKARSSAPELGGYSSGDGASGSVGGPRPMTRSQSHHAVQPSPPRAGRLRPPPRRRRGRRSRRRRRRRIRTRPRYSPPAAPGGHRGGRRGGGARGGGAPRRRRPLAAALTRPLGGSTPPARRRLRRRRVRTGASPRHRRRPGPMAHLEHQMAHAHLHAPHDGKAHLPRTTAITTATTGGSHGAPAVDGVVGDFRGPDVHDVCAC